MIDRKRTVPRMEVRWAGTCRLEKDPPGVWRACRILDISPAGVGLEVEGIAPLGAATEDVVVTFQLSGHVTFTGLADEGSTRIGVELHEVDAEVNADLEELRRSPVRW